MNIRKTVDYSTMFATLEAVMEAELPQMELYCEIGKAVCARMEKGAAVAAAEFLKEQYPDMTGFSPRNVRRMRDFWQMYGDMPELLGEALHLNWTQNVVIMEAELTAEERRWYIRQAAAQNLSKSELLQMIENSAHFSCFSPIVAKSGSGLPPGIWVQGFARSVHLAGQRLRRRPDKCDAGRRPSGRRIPRPAASGRTRSLCRSSSSRRNRFAGFRREPCWGR